MRIIEELENATAVLDDLIENHDYLKECERSRFGGRITGRKHTCPRCRSVTVLQTDAPYCSYCNWDSLEDQTNFQMS